MVVPSPVYEIVFEKLLLSVKYLIQNLELF